MAAGGAWPVTRVHVGPEGTQLRLPLGASYRRRASQTGCPPEVSPSGSRLSLLAAHMWVPQVAGPATGGLVDRYRDRHDRRSKATEDQCVGRSSHLWSSRHTTTSAATTAATVISRIMPSCRASLTSPTPTSMSLLVSVENTCSHDQTGVPGLIARLLPNSTRTYAQACHASAHADMAHP